MRKLLSLLALFALLSGCSTYAPGEDKKGLQLQSEGTQVLEAVRNYMDGEARLPRSLNDLIPKYLKSLPDEPRIHFDAQAGRLDFMYVQDGTNGMAVACHAAIGETQWTCVGGFMEPKQQQQQPQQ
jgi:hypothetical protein